MPMKPLLVALAAASTAVCRGSVRHAGVGLALIPVLAVAFAATLGAQQAGFDRLPPDVLDAVPPAERVTGEPGAMKVRRASCGTAPMDEVRRRIVDLAVQEWAFFGFIVVDQTIDEASGPGQPRRRRWRRPGRAESARVAASIAGYWAVTPQGGWIIGAQNDRWRGPRGVASRWRYPWSAAFVSWVMCEAGLGEASLFQRAVAHHAYIDQAIRARGPGARGAAFAAYDVGEAPVVPGDLLCSARRPAYRSIAERRRQLGVGARTHCDIVVKVEPARSRILAIGGNVRGAVSLKLLPAADDGPDGSLRPLPTRRRIFAHLKLRAPSIAADALDRTPTMRAAWCADGFRLPPQAAAASPVGPGSRC